MNKEVASQLFEKLEKYNLSNRFKSKEELKKWLLSLNKKQINNFLSLNIEKKKINFPFETLINLDLLNCEDYQKKLETFCNIKDGWYNLFNELLNPTFLNSPKFYADMEMLSKPKTAQYVLWIIGKDDFINSPYHDEDLKLLVESRDCNKDRPLDFVVWDAIATVAGDKNSINSPYHRIDMKMMIEAGSKCLQMSHSYLGRSLNYLAVNPISLKDKYHLENMKVLATHPEYGEWLYKLMTNEEIINGKFYREEINALANAKDETTARCLFYYIFNPHKKYRNDDEMCFSNNSYMFSDIGSKEFSYYEMREISDKPIVETPYGYYKNEDSFEIKEAQKKYSKLKLLPEYDYLNGLKIISNAPAYYNFFYVSLLMNKYFALSPNRNFDLEILKNINIEKLSDKFLFVEIYKLMTEKEFQESPYHRKDLEIIINSVGLTKQFELIELAKDEKNISSFNHEFDMNFVSNLDIENIDPRIMDEIRYYIYGAGISYDVNHIEILNRLQFMKSIDEYNQSMTEDIFGEVLTELDKSKQEQTEKEKSKILQKIKKLFN